MARTKVLYTKTEITENLYTTGSQYMKQDNTEYIGLYHTYITGEIYTEAKWNPAKSEPLLPFKIQNPNTEIYRKLKPNIQTTYNSINTIIPTIDIENRKAGMISRYFVQNVSNKKIFEVDKQQYDSYQNKLIDKNLYQVIKLTWYISGNINDKIIGTVLKKGVKSKNQRAIKFAQQSIPGLSAKLTNLLEYYADTDFIVPADINPK